MPTISQRAVRAQGLRELQRAFSEYNREMGKDFRQAFLAAGEPVRQSAESLAESSIRRIRPPWSSMRVGFTGGVVWIAPVARGRKRGSARTERRRRSDLLFASRLGEQMDRAADQNIARVESELDDQLRELGRHWERV